MKQVARRPVIVKLSPNVSAIEPLARAAEESGADALSLVNTFIALAIDARTRRPRIGAGFGGLSGPAIKPIALRLVYQAARAVKIPVIGLGGIATRRGRGGVPDRRARARSRSARRTSGIRRRRCGSRGNSASSAGASGSRKCAIWSALSRCDRHGPSRAFLHVSEGKSDVARNCLWLQHLCYSARRQHGRKQPRPNMPPGCPFTR